MKAILSAALGMVVALSATEAGAQGKTADRKVELAIEQQSLADALNEWAKQTGLQLVSSSSEMMNTTLAPPIKGAYTPSVALEELLKGTSLTYEWVSERAVAIREKPPIVPAALKSGAADPNQVNVPIARFSGDTRSEQQFAANDPADSGGAEFARNSGQNGQANRDELEEIVVTGTHIRGATSSASPITAYSRDDILRSGAGTLQDFAQRIPQNYANISENTVGAVAGGGDNANRVSASSFNLRGLGDGATLTLVNGHRVAPGGDNGSTVDLSMIPVAAIKRIDVVPDGASAIYGSDAVGGVVNILLRSDFDGAETTARYGSVTSGSSDQLQVAQTLGKTWSDGSLLGIYQYSRQTPLDAADRSFSEGAAGLKLLPSQNSNTAFLTARHNISDDFEYFGDANFARRNTAYDLANGPNFLQTLRGTIENYGGSVGFSYELTQQTTLDVSTTYEKSDSDIEVANALTGAALIRNNVVTDVLALEASSSGALFAIGSHSLRYAIGAQYREESFSQDNLVTLTRFAPSRSLWAAFGEVTIPLLGSTAGAEPVLELTLAGRHEDYNDFGSTDNPKYGLIWRPFLGAQFRGTYGSSFKAPRLADMNPTLLQAAPLPEPDPTTGGFTNTLLIFGGNPDLKPERSRNWTAGFDFQFSATPNFNASVTYFDIEFRDRITNPQFLAGLLDVLNQEALFGPRIVQRNPPAALIQQYIDGPWFFNPFQINPATIAAVADFRQQNLSELQTKGVDANLAYRLEIPGGQLQFGLNGTYLTKYSTQVTPTTEPTDVVDTVYNPPSLRLRANVGFDWNRSSVTLFGNHTGSYKDTRVASAGRVASWTTFDLSMVYRWPSTAGLLADCSLAASVVNLADKDPPFVANPSFPVFFDGSNANALGRYVALVVQKSW